MIVDSGVLADKKLLILYLLSRMGIPLSKPQITNAVLENNLIDFFTFQQCIFDLEESGMIKHTVYQKRQCFTATDRGEKTVEVFEQRIPKDTSRIINNYISKNKDSLRKESQLIAEYKKIKEKEYIVSLKVIENDLLLMDLKLNVVSAKQAKQICEKWKNHSENIYSQLMSSLIN